MSARGGQRKRKIAATANFFSTATHAGVRVGNTRGCVMSDLKDILEEVRKAHAALDAASSRLFGWHLENALAAELDGETKPPARRPRSISHWGMF